MVLKKISTMLFFSNSQTWDLIAMDSNQLVISSWKFINSSQVQEMSRPYQRNPAMHDSCSKSSGMCYETNHILSEIFNPSFYLQKPIMNR